MHKWTTYRPLFEGSKTGSFLANSMWRQLVGVKAITPDGKVRTVRVAQAPDTFFSIRGFVSLFGLSLSGFVMVGEDKEYHFHVSKDCTNYERFSALLAGRAALTAAPTGPATATVHLQRCNATGHPVGRTACGRKMMTIPVGCATTDPNAATCESCRSSLYFTICLGNHATA